MIWLLNWFLFFLFCFVLLSFFFSFSVYCYKNFDPDRYNKQFLLLIFFLKLTGLVSIWIGSPVLFFLIIGSLLHRAINQRQDDSYIEEYHPLYSQKITVAEYEIRSKECTESSLKKWRETFMSRQDNSDFEETQVANK